MQLTFCFAYLQLSHFVDLQEHVIIHLLALLNVSNHFGVNLVRLADGHSHPQSVGLGVSIFTSQPFYIHSTCRDDRLICSIKRVWEIIVERERKSGLGDLNKLLTHLCLNTYNHSKNKLTSNNFRLGQFVSCQLIQVHYSKQWMFL